MSFLSSVLEHQRPDDAGVDGEGHEENVSSVGISRPEPAVAVLHLMYEFPLCRVYVLAGPIVDYWLLPFFVHIHLEYSFHLHITPAIALYYQDQG